jgi:hypothetical protein
MPAAGPDRAAPGYRGGDIVTTFTSRDLETADELALARLDDDGAPPPVTWPQADDSHDRDAIRRRQPAPDVPAGAPASDIPAGAPAPAE